MVNLYRYNLSMTQRECIENLGISLGFTDGVVKQPNFIKRFHRPAQSADGTKNPYSNI